MGTKKLRQAGPIDCVIHAVLGCLVLLLLLWTMQWVLMESTKELLSPTTAVVMMCTAIALNNLFASKLPVSGLQLAVAESLGIVVAFGVFFWPLPLQQIIIMWFVLGTVSHYSSLVRIARLKRLGFTEVRPNRRSS